jgi:hypothetical protein
MARMDVHMPRPVDRDKSKNDHRLDSVVSYREPRQRD